MEYLGVICLIIGAVLITWAGDALASMLGM